MTALVLLVLSYVAMAALALSMGRHQDCLAGPGASLAPRTVLLLRTAGWGLLLVALALAVAAWGASVGAVGLLGVTTFAALGVGLQLTYAPATARWAPSAAALLAVLLVALNLF